MAGTRPPTPPSRPYPTGILTLAGVIGGALTGWLAGEVPILLVVGLALGVGADSLLNIRLNGAPGLMKGTVSDDD